MCCSSDMPMTDYGKAAADAIYKDLNLLPFRRQIEAASRAGEDITIDGITYPFSGLGDADAAGASAEKMAQALLDIQRKYGTEFVAQRVRELEQADPQGQAARRKLWTQVQSQLANATSADRPAAQALESAVLAELEKGATISEGETREVQQGVRGSQAGRGNVLGNAAVAQEAQAVAGYGEARKGEREAEAQQYLQSGVSPEDVTYRRVQQAIADTGSFLSGTTPTAQFGGLSSAGGGAAPMLTTGPSVTRTNPNAGATGASNTLDIYRQSVNWNSQQANPFTAGIGVGARTYGLLYAAGKKPTAP